MRRTHHLVTLGLLLLLAGPWGTATTGCVAKRSELRMAEGLRADSDGDRLAAAKAYRAALQADPNVRGAANNLAVIALERGDKSVAVTLLDSELERHPTLAAARFNRAVVRLELGELDAAHTELTELLGEAHAELVPHVGRALAATRWLQGADADAVRETLADGDADPLAQALRDALKDRRMQQAEHQARTAAAAASAAGQWEDALSALGDARSDDAVLDRAIALAHLGRLADARTAVAMVVARSPDAPRATALAELLAP